LQLQAEIQPPIQPHEGEQSITDAQQPVELKTTADKTLTPVPQETPKTESSEDVVSALVIPGTEQTSEKSGEETPPMSPMETSAPSVVMEPTETEASQAEKPKRPMVAEVQGIWSKLTKVNPNYQRVPLQKDK
jgi:hypothetical protein